MKKQRKVFRLHDLKHITWLLKNAIKQLLKGNLDETKEAIYFVKIHLKYDSQKKTFND